MTDQHPQPHNNGIPEPQPVQVAPVETMLNSCRFQVGQRDGKTAISFIHLTGVIAYTAILEPAGVTELVRQLTGGIEIASTIPIQ